MGFLSPASRNPQLINLHAPCPLQRGIFSSIYLLTLHPDRKKMTDHSNRKIVLAVTGASGSVYALSLLERLTSLKTPVKEIAVVFSDTAKEVWKHETGLEIRLSAPANEYQNNSYFVPFASGSANYDTMIICPASMGTIGRIANGTSDDLIARAADVILKERRRLIIVPREAPYNLIHIKNMETLTLAGAVICPASPSFYSKPDTIDDLIKTVTDRIMSLAGFDDGTYKWMEND
jgi:4-hydroxy-3-polyprenylbenzoate decarboxylase